MRATSAIIASFILAVFLIQAGGLASCVASGAAQVEQAACACAATGITADQTPSGCQADCQCHQSVSLNGYFNTIRPEAAHIRPAPAAPADLKAPPRPIFQPPRV